MIHSEAELLLAAGAALEDLGPDEWREYQAHRRTCAECARLEVELDEVLADLALAIPERVPPPDLLAGIRRSIAAQDADDAAGGERDGPAGAVAEAGGDEWRGTGLGSPVASPRPAEAPEGRDVTDELPAPLIALDRSVRPAPVAARPASRAWTVASLGLAAVLGIVAVAMGARSMALTDELLAARAQIADLRLEMTAQSAAMAVAIDPAHETAVLHAEPTVPGATAFVVYVPGTDDAWLVAHGLPATPDGHGYQLWFADEAGVHGLGTYRFDGQGAFVAPFDVDLAGSEAAMVTLEPAGGAQGEPGPQVVFGEL